MSATLPEAARAWLDDRPFVTLATVLPDGQPHLSVVWAARDGDDLLFSTVVGRRKEVNLRRDPRASALCVAPTSPYNYLEVRGRCTLTTQGARELIDSLAQRYTGQSPFGGDGPDDVRVIVRLTPTKVVFRG